MIKDKLENIHRYSINADFEHFKFFLKNLKNNDYSKIEKPFKAIPLEYTTGEFNLTKFENHQQYIDIHYIVDGEEQIGLNSIEVLLPNMEYDAENDYQLFNGEVKEVIILGKGDFLLLFPGEVHVTGGVNNRAAQSLKKIVFKVPI